jgi:hypothetical protein
MRATGGSSYCQLLVGLLKKTPVIMTGVFFRSIKNLMLAPTYSAPEGVPSAMESLTSVFGMRTGVPSPLKHQH